MTRKSVNYFWDKGEMKFRDTKKSEIIIVLDNFRFCFRDNCIKCLKEKRKGKG